MPRRNPGVARGGVARDRHHSVRKGRTPALKGVPDDKDIPAPGNGKGLPANHKRVGILAPLETHSLAVVCRAKPVTNAS